MSTPNIQPPKSLFLSHVRSSSEFTPKNSQIARIIQESRMQFQELSKETRPKGLSSRATKSDLGVSSRRARG